MIKKQTTFVLGAGASMAYGFPSGKTLKALIWKKLEPAYLPGYFFKAAGIDINNTIIYDSLSQKSPREEYESKIREFRNLLKLSPDETIDYFLEHVGDDEDTKNNYRLIGRLAIVYVLLEREQENSLFDHWMEYFSLEKEFEQKNFLENKNKKIRPDDGHWYRLLFNQMCRECPTIDEFLGNQVSVITFNYDRSFEYYFLCALMSKYKVDEGKAAKVLNQLKIVHVYGQLGELQELIPQNRIDKKRDAVPYAAFSKAEDRAENLKNAADGIQLIWDNPDKNENIKQARELIYRERNQVIFLGFGYDPTNLDRIMPQREINIDMNMSSHGTIYGLSKQRLQDLNTSYVFKYQNGTTQGFFGSRFMGHEIGDLKDCKIYDFLYNSTGLLS